MNRPTVFAAVAIALACIATGAEDQATLQLANTDVREVLAAYERLTAFKIVTDSGAIGMVKIRIAQPIPKAEAIAMIEQTLFANGYSLIQLDQDTIRVVGIGKNARNEGIPFVSKAEDIPASERLISFVIKLQFRQPEELVPILLRHTAASPALGNILVADPTARAIIVTDRSSIVRNLIKLVKEIDVPKRK